MCYGRVNSQFQAYPINNGVVISGEAKNPSGSFGVNGAGVIANNGKPIAGSLGIQSNNNDVSLRGNVNINSHGKPNGANIAGGVKVGENVTTFANVDLSKNGRPSGGSVGVSYNF